MAAARWTLLILMVLVGPLLWWSGVNSTASAAGADLAPDDPTLPYFLSNYRSAGLSMAGLFAVLNLLLLLVLLPRDRELRKGRTGTRVRAVIGAVLVTSLAWFEYRFNPMADWSGDPDAWSVVKDHVKPWHPVGTVWLALNTVAAAAIAVRALLTTRRPADQLSAPG
jgi:hypothetical protein